MDLMWFLLLAHFAGDFAFQTDRMAERKRSSQSVLTLHVLIYVATIGLMVVGYELTVSGMPTKAAVLPVALGGLFVVHWLQDDLKGRFFLSRQAYYLDQLLHVIQLFVLRGLLT